MIQLVCSGGKDVSLGLTLWLTEAHFEKKLPCNLGALHLSYLLEKLLGVNVRSPGRDNPYHLSSIHLGVSFTNTDRL